MKETARLWVCFSVAERRFAAPLQRVERVIRAVEVTPVPQAPETLCGVINVQGHLLPVVNLRRVLNLPAREILPEDHFIIARAAHRRVAFWVDGVTSTLESVDNLIDETGAALKSADGLRLLQDFEKLFPVEVGALCVAKTP